MTKNEELMFGLKMWINKGIKYLNKMSFEEFYNDEKTLDACCFCILMISNISNEISKINELTSKYKNLNFTELSNTYFYSIKGDNINLSYIYDLFNEGFPLLLEELN